MILKEKIPNAGYYKYSQTSKNPSMTLKFAFIIHLAPNTPGLKITTILEYSVPTDLEN